MLLAACLLLAAAAPLRAAADDSIRYAPAAFVQPSAPWPAVLGAVRGEEQLGPGVTHERWRLATEIGPLELSILRVDLHNPYVTLSAATHNGVVVGPDEALSAMADHARAEAGINADYFDIGGSGTPLNILISNGVALHQPDGRAAFMVGPGNAVQMGPMSLRAHITTADTADVTVDSINDWSSSTQLALVNARLGVVDTSGATEAVLKPTDAAGRYRVDEMKTAAAALALAPQNYALLARAAAADDLVARLHVGDVVSLTYESQPDVGALREAVGGGPLLVRDGVPFEDQNAPAPQERDVRYPLTGAGVSADGGQLVLVAVDGRAPARSIGVTRPMLAALLIALGAQTGMAFDSGGSTEMVVRHLGDESVSVANAPSDGRERSIADALLILNTAPAGPASQLILRARAPAVLAGSHPDIRIRAVDEHDQPVASEAAVHAQLSSDPASAFSSGDLIALRPGRATIGADASGVRGSLEIEIVPSIAKLSIARLARFVAPGSRVQLAIVPTTQDGTPIAVDASAVRWEASGEGGRVEADGTFAAAPRASKATITAIAGGARAEQQLLVGEHLQMLEAIPQAGDGPKQWRHAATPSTQTGGLDNAPAPDGSPAMHLTFDLTGTTGTRAGYAERELKITGEPLAISLDVYGDGSGVWLRGAYKNADGIVDSVTLARHLDWKGWKTVRVAVPVQARWPITWTRLYVVDSSKDGHAAGDIWLRNLAAWYAGP